MSVCNILAQVEQTFVIEGTYVITFVAVALQRGQQFLFCVDFSPRRQGVTLDIVSWADGKIASVQCSGDDLPVWLDVQFVIP